MENHATSNGMEKVNGADNVNAKNADVNDNSTEIIIEEIDVVLEEVQPSADDVEQKQAENVSEQNIQEAEEKKNLDKQGVIDALKELLQKEGKDITREEINKLRNIFNNLRREEIEAEKRAHIEAGKAEEDFRVSLDADEQTMLTILNDLRQKKAEWLEAKEQELKANLEEKEKIIEEINNLAEDTDNVNRSYKSFKELSQRFREIGDVSPENSTSVWKRFQDAEQRFYDQLKVNQELRDYDFKKNQEIKQGIIDKAKELASKVSETIDDTAQNINNTVINSFRALQDLHELWKVTGPVAKDLRDEMWESFREATVIVNKAYQNFFEQRKALEKESEEAKKALISKVEAIETQELKTPKQWDNATKEVVDAQAKWKETGFVPRKINNELFARFRKACDDFFSSKSEFFSELKQNHASNLELKTRLTEQAEELSGSTDWNATAALLTKLQNEWKTIGPTPRKEGDALWERFHSACDTFFNNRKTALSEQRKAEKENLDKKEQLLENLKSLLEQEKDIKDELASIQQEWKNIGYVPIKEKNRIADEYRDITNRIRRKFNLKEMRASFDRFINQVEELGNDNSKLNKERERLFRFLENKRADLNNYLNNMGFLRSKSKSGDGLLKEIEHKIQLIQADIVDLEQRISLIDSKLN